MATSYLTMKGIAKWALLQVPDREYNSYKITLYPDQASMAKFHQSGLQNKPKQDEDGEHITFRRPVEKVFKGKLQEMGPPEVKMRDGSPLKDFVGNGSTVEVEIEVYDTKRGKGGRLAKVTVDNLVPYEKKSATDGLPS